MQKDLFRLVINLIVLTIIIVVGFLVYNHYFKEDSGKIIDDTPIHIESIKIIAEISTVSYKDEVVVDTVEFYQKQKSIYDPREWMRYYDRNIKRRLTLIIRGEVKYGVDLTGDKYDVQSNEDTIWLHLPEPKILDVIITPSKTEVFQEKGNWNDSDRRNLETSAKMALIKNAEMLKLQEKSRINSLRLFKALMQTKKKLIIDFNHEK